MPNSTIVVDLPADEAAFLEAYAKEHGITLAELVSRYVQRLRSIPRGQIHPEVTAITGIVPADVDARGVYRQHVLEKHR